MPSQVAQYATPRPRSSCSPGSPISRGEAPVASTTALARTSPSLVLEDVRTGARRELACEGIFVAIGRVPDTELFRGQVELDEQGYIKADETTRTGLPGVFAVGDVRTKPLRQIVTATADGATASHFIEQYLMEENR